MEYNYHEYVCEQYNKLTLLRTHEYKNNCLHCLGDNDNMKYFTAHIPELHITDTNNELNKDNQNFLDMGRHQDVPCHSNNISDGNRIAVSL